MLIVDRTHRLADDLAWAPPRLRRWSPRPRRYHEIVEPPSSGPGAADVLLGLDVIGLPVLVLGGIAKWVFKDRSATYDSGVVERLGALHARRTDLRGLAHLAADEVVRVEGRVVATHLLDGVMHARRGVARRIVFRASGRWWVHEAVVELSIEDGNGVQVPVQVAGARILAPLGAPETRPLTDFLAERVPEGVRKHYWPSGDPTEIVRFAEAVIEHGDRVTIFGHAVQVPAEDGVGGGYRDAPTRPALAGGPSMPLLIVTWAGI